jgi:hypothetical protein
MNGAMTLVPTTIPRALLAVLHGHRWPVELAPHPSYSSDAACLAARRDSITIVPPEMKAITQ